MNNLSYLLFCTWLNIAGDSIEDGLDEETLQQIATYTIHIDVLPWSYMTWVCLY